MGRRTRQGTLISETIRQAKRPLTPAEIHTAAMREIPNLGLATILQAREDSCRRFGSSGR
jgi:Fe2+ or Zn2+ uptake regulation protein